MVMNLLSEKIYIFIFFAFFSLVLRILIVCLCEEISRKFEYKDETLWEKYKKDN
jgi:hypothetical protein